MIFALSWVLWGNGLSRFAAEWNVISGHASLTECRKAVPAQVRKLLKLEGAARQAPDKVYFSRPTDEYYGETTLRLVCLPAEIDPRRKK